VRPTSIAAGIVSAYLKKHPAMASRTAARALCKQDPQVFPSYGNTYSMIRYQRGAGGKAKRSYDSDRTDYRPQGHADDVDWKINDLPLSTSEIRRDFILGEGRVLLLSDIHLPYHDRKAVELAVEHGVKRKPDVIYLNGDTSDFYQISAHDKDPNRSFKDELNIVRQFLFWLRGKFPKARIIYKIGNHDDRMARYLRKNAPVLLDIPDFHLARFLRFADMGIELVHSLQICRMGKLPVLHGHELPKGGGVNPARWFWLKVDETGLIGHFHSTSEHIAATGIKKKILNSWSVGCLCDMAPDYAMVNRWNHGFADIEIARDGDYNVANRKIINGKIH